MVLSRRTMLLDRCSRAPHIEPRLRDRGKLTRTLTVNLYMTLRARVGRLRRMVGHRARRDSSHYYAPFTRCTCTPARRSACTANLTNKNKKYLVLRGSKCVARSIWALLVRSGASRSVRRLDVRYNSSSRPPLSVRLVRSRSLPSS